MKRPKNGSTVKQFAYANRLINGEGLSRKDIARSVGFSPSVARNPSQKIEKSEGFHNAMIKLATEANNMALAVMHEYKARGLKGFSNKDLNGALNAIAGAFERFNKHRAPNKEKDNPLRKILLERVQTREVSIVQPKEVVAEEVANANDDEIEGWGVGDESGTEEENNQVEENDDPMDF